MDNIEKFKKKINYLREQFHLPRSTSFEIKDYFKWLEIQKIDELNNSILNLISKFDLKK